MQKEHTGCLLKMARSIQSLQIKGKNDFGESGHTASTEPYFYDSAYQLVKRPYAIPIDENGKCIIAKQVKKESAWKQWQCTNECKGITPSEELSIVTFKQSFECSIQEVCRTLDKCDECPQTHYTKTSGGVAIDRKGHPLIRSIGAGCKSQLRILKAAATHYPLLGKFLHNVHTAIQSHVFVHDIDQALCAGDFRTLMELTEMTDFETMLTNDVESTYKQCTDFTVGAVFPQLESQLVVRHAKLITQLEQQIKDYPEHICCSCEQLHQRKSVTRVNISDNLGSEVWERLKSFILQENPSACDMFMCKYCKPLIRNKKLPAHCVLNGLQLDPVPPELAKLNSLSKQLIQ